MSKISKEKSGELAEVILKKNEVLKEKMNKDVMALNSRIVSKYIPEGVKQIMKTDDKKFIRTSTSVNLMLVDSSQNISSSTLEPVPVNMSLSSYNANFILSEEDFSKVKQMNDSYERCRSEYRKLYNELTDVIYALKSKTALIREFPAQEDFIIKLMEPNGSMLPSNLTELKSKILK